MANVKVSALRRDLVLNRGGGTSLPGETVNTAVVVDHSKYLDLRARRARAVRNQLRRAASAPPRL